MGEESGIVTEGLGQVVYRVVVGGIDCSFSLVASVLVSKELEGLSTLKSFGTKCTRGLGC